MSTKTTTKEMTYDKRIDPLLVKSTGALALTNLFFEIAEHLPNLNIATIATLAALGSYGALKTYQYGIKPLAERTKNHTPKTIQNQYIRRGILGFALLGTLYGLSDEGSLLYSDLHAKTNQTVNATTYSPKKVLQKKNKKFKEELENIVSEEEQTTYDGDSLPNFKGVKLADKNSIVGRIQRTYRWNKVTESVEKKYNIPTGTLSGLIMQESYGDPLQPNGSNDGGIGLIHTQGTTAKSLGLQIYGNSQFDADHEHGMQLQDLFDTCNFKLECIMQKDERANPLKNLDSIARYMLQGQRKHNSWDAGVQWVRGPGHVNKRVGLAYLERVNAFKNAITDEDSLAVAKSDFEKRNNAFDRRQIGSTGKGLSFEEYMSAFHEYSQKNFGLESYTTSTK